MRHRAAPLLALVQLVAPAAEAGNLDSFLLGNQAAMTGGAVVALTRDGEAIWYNPAGLGAAGLHRSARTMLDVSASAFALRIRPMAGALETVLPDETIVADLTGIDILSVPSALVFVRRLIPGLSVGLGIFVPVQDEFQIEDVLRVKDADTFLGKPVDYEQRGLLGWDVTEYHLGLAVGWQATDTLRMGASVFVTYTTSRRTTEFWSHIGTPQTAFADVTTLQNTFEHRKAVGGHAALGVQWEPAPDWHLGLMIRSPTVFFATFAEGHILEIPAFKPITAPGSTLVNTDNTNRGLQVTRPLRVHLGVGYTFPGGSVSLEGDLQPALLNEEIAIERRLTWNLRAGTRFQVSKRVFLGAGLFTDRSPNPDPQLVGDLRIDYYGGTFGFELHTPHRVSGRPDSEPLILATTLAIRYALGVGEYGGIRVNPLSTNPGVQRVEYFQRDALFHEVSLHVGSALYF